MYIYGQIQKVSYELLSSDPSAGVVGRFWYNTTSTKAMVDDGTNIRALLRNDQVCVFGNSGTAANNIRFQRGANAVLQFVLGSDATAEGSLSTSLAQISAKQEGYANASKPANGNAGRTIWITDNKFLSVDDGTNWLNLTDISSTQTLTNKTLTSATLTTPAVDIPLFSDQGSDPSAPASTKTKLYTKSGHVYKMDSGGTAVQLAETGTTNPWTVQSKSSAYTVLTSDDVIVCSGASWTLALYTPVGNAGRAIRIIHNGTSLTQLYTLTTPSGNIGGIASGSYILATASESLSLVSDGTNWQISDHKTTVPWTFYSPTFSAGLGSPTSISYYWTRVGASMRVRGTHINGTTAASLFSMTIPSGASIDTTAISINNTISNPGSLIGQWVDSGSTVSYTNMVSATGTSTTLVYFGGFSNGAAKLTPANGNNSGTGVTASIIFEIPISGWQP